METVQSTAALTEVAPRSHRMRRFFKWTLLAVSLFIVLVTLLVVGLYYSLRSPAFFERVLPYAKPFLEPLGVEIKQLGSLSFDLFGSLELHNLDARYHDEKVGDVAVKVGTLAVRYDFDGLLNNALTVNAFELKDVSIKGTLKSAQAEPEQPKPEQDWVTLENLLSSPPMTTRLESLQVENVGIELRIENGKQWQHVNAQLLSMSSGLVWSPRLLEGKTALRLSKEKDVLLFAFGNESERTDVRFTPKLDLDAGWRLVKSNNHWRVDRFTFDQHMAITEPSIQQTRAGKSVQTGDLKSMGLDVHVDGKTVANPSAEPGLASIFPLAVNAHVKSAVNGLAVDGFKQDRMVLTTRLDHQLDANIKGDLHPFQSPPPQVRFDFSQVLNIPNLDARLPGQHIRLKNLSLSIQANGDAPLDPKLSKPVMVNAKIAGGAGLVNFEKSAGKQGESTMVASLSPTILLAAQGEVKSLANLPNGIVLKFSPEFHTKDIDVTLGSGKEAQRIRVARQDLSAKGTFDGRLVDLNGTLDVVNVLLPQLKKSITLSNSFAVKTDVDAIHASAKLDARLDGQPLLRADIGIDNQAKHLDIRHDLEIEASTRLQAIHAAADALKQTGGVRLTLRGKSRLDHGAKDIRAADLSKVSQLPLQTEGEVRVLQLSKPADPNGVVLSVPLTLVYDVAKTRDFVANLKLDLPGVQLPPLKAPVALTLSQQARFTWPLAVTDTSGKLGIDGAEAASFSLRLDDKPNNAHLNVQLTVVPDPAWQRFLADLKALENVGKLALDINLDAQLEHVSASVLDFQPKDHLERSRAQAKLALGIQPFLEKPGKLVRLLGPMKLTQNIDWSSDNASGEGDFQIAGLEVPGKVTVNGLSGSWRVGADSGLKPKSAHVDLKLGKAQIELAAALAGGTSLKVGDLITPFSLQAAATMNEQQVDLWQSSLNVGGDLLVLSASGAASFDGKNGQLETTLALRPRNNLLASPSISGAGKVELPLRVTLFNGEQITLEGGARFDEFSLSFNDIQLQRLSGNMKVEEELLWRDKSLRFRYLLDADPFQRVDFGRIEPYLGADQSVTFFRVAAGSIGAGPGIATMVFKQNLLRLQRFDVDMFDGHVAGQFYLNARPGAWKLGVVSRVTQLDPRFLIADKKAASAKVRAPVSARTAVEFDLNRRLLEGRVDVTEINREQLLQILDIVDPNHTDEQLATVRSALRFAYPKEVAIEMREGLMDLKVVLSALPNPIRVRGLPLSPLLQAFAGDAMRAVEKLPLK